jgi:hypothetical protein
MCSGQKAGALIWVGETQVLTDILEFEAWA